MPQNTNIQKLLVDISTAIADIEVFTTNKTLENFLSDRQLQAATERELEIIGEALNRLMRENTEFVNKHIEDAHAIIGMRNVIAHGYDALEHEIIWDCVEQEIPKLKTKVLFLLSD